MSVVQRLHHCAVQFAVRGMEGSASAARDMALSANDMGEGPLTEALYRNSTAQMEARLEGVRKGEAA